MSAALPHWADLPNYDHRRHCQWGHIQKACPSGCNGEPVEHPETVESAPRVPRGGA